MAHFSPSGAVRQFVEFAQFNGLRLESILDADLFAQLQICLAEDLSPANVLVDAIQKCAIDMDRPDLGLAFAGWTNLRGFGPLSVLWDHCSTLGEWISISSRYLHVETTALGTAIDYDDDEVAMRNFLIIPSRYGGSQFLHFTMGLEARLARRILGEDWTPLRVHFDHPAPANTRYHRMFFRCPLEFDSDRCSVVVRKTDLSHRTTAGNAQMLAYLERNLMAGTSSTRFSLIHQVEKLMMDKLASGEATLPQMAMLLHMSPRTLQRRLAVSGDSFASVLARVRHRVAEQYFAATQVPSLIELAHRLGYADASATSRFLRHALGAGLRSVVAARTNTLPLDQRDNAKP